MKEMLIPIDDINPYDGTHFIERADWELKGYGDKDYIYHQEGIQMVKEGLAQGRKIRPIAVRERVNDYYDMKRKYERLDGYKRYTAMKELGWKEVPCFVFEKDEASPGCQDSLPFFID